MSRLKFSTGNMGTENRAMRLKPRFHHEKWSGFGQAYGKDTGFKEENGEIPHLLYLQYDSFHKV
jgi:hypothetical protein